MSIGENCYCWPLKRVWKKVASQVKASEKSGNLDMDIEWQPCTHTQRYVIQVAFFDKRINAIQEEIKHIKSELAGTKAENTKLRREPFEIMKQC